MQNSNMVRVGIITFSYSHNVGSALQTYALQKVINSLEIPNIQAEVINYEKKDWLSFNKKISILSFFIKLRIYLFNSFQRKYIRFNRTKRYHSVEDLEPLNNNYECFIAGSDQIWNLNISKVDSSYFLAFVKDDNKKIAYAPSFGEDTIPQEYRHMVSNYISSFNYLSSREVSGRDLIYNLTGRRSKLVLDPTFLLNVESWNEILQRNFSIKDYILVYVRDHNFGCTKNFSKYLSQITGKKCIVVDGVCFEGKPLKIVKPDKWLSLVKNASYVVTNSFHAVVFSLIFHVPFYVDANQHKSRIISLLELLNLKQRIITSHTKELIDMNIDFDACDKILAEERNKSISYLYNSILSV